MFRTPDHLVKSQMLFLGTTDSSLLRFNLAELQAHEVCAHISGFCVPKEWLYLFIADVHLFSICPPQPMIKPVIRHFTIQGINKGCGTIGFVVFIKQGRRQVCPRTSHHLQVSTMSFDNAHYTFFRSNSTSPWWTILKIL